MKVCIVDDLGTKHEVSLDTRQTCNVCVVALIDNSSPFGAKFVNTSKAGTLTGLKTLEQLLEIIDG